VARKRKQQKTETTPEDQTPVTQTESTVTTEDKAPAPETNKAPVEAEKRDFSKSFTIKRH